MWKSSLQFLHVFQIFLHLNFWVSLLASIFIPIFSLVLQLRCIQDVCTGNVAPKLIMNHNDNALPPRRLIPSDASNDYSVSLD